MMDKGWILVIALISSLAIAGTLVIFLLMLDQKASTIGVNQVLIKVEYNGEWQGSYGDQTVLVGWSSTGPRTVSLKKVAKINLWFIEASAQKLDNSSKTLKLMIMKTDGTVLKEDSTSAPYGLIQITYSIQD